MSRRVMINLIAFGAVFVLMLWWAASNIIAIEALEKPYEIKGEFAATAGVATNSEVAYLGVNYGRVSKVEPFDDHVMITMKVDRGKEIPARSIARIFRKSAIGEPYVDFNPPADYSDTNTTFIEPGEVIPLDRTQVPLEFSELLRSASRVLAAVDPEQTRTLVHELAVALNGRGEELRDLTVSSDALLATFAERTELLDRLSTNNTRLTRIVTERRDSLSSSISDLADLAQSLRAVEPDTKVLLDRGTELLGQTADLVADINPNLDCVLSDLTDVIELTTTDANLDNLRHTLENTPRALDFVFMTRDNEPGGVWVRVNLLVNQENPPQQYVPPTELPAVPQVPPCVSSLGSGGVRFESAPVSGGTLPATGGRTLPAAGLFLVTAAILTVAARRSLRSTDA